MMLLKFDTRIPTFEPVGILFFVLRKEAQFIGPIQLAILRDVMSMQLMGGEHRNLCAGHTGISVDRHISEIYQETPVHIPG